MTVAGSEIASDGYIKSFDLRETGEIIPSSTGGSASTYMCDYHWCNASSTALRTLRVGGRAFYGSASGLGYFGSYGGVSFADSAVGFLGCATREIAQHFGKYFAKEIFDAKYGDTVKYQWIR